MANMHLVTGFAGEPHVTAADFGAFWAAIIGNGDYVLDHGQKFAATIASNNLIRIADGELLMQGRHGRIDKGATVELTIENGTAGMLRSDLIVARYTKSEETGVEETNLVVILGTPAESSPADPEYITGDILNGDLQRDFPLFRVNLNGATISSIDTLFTTIPGMLANNELLSAAINAQIATLDSRIDTAETAVSTAAKIKTGSYTGTGTANQMSITCGFEPKHVIIMASGETDFVFYTGRGLTEYVATVESESKLTYTNSSGATTQLNFPFSNTITVTVNNAGIVWKTNIPTTHTITHQENKNYTGYYTTIPTNLRARANYNTSSKTYYYMILG